MKKIFLLYLSLGLISCSNDIDYTSTYTASKLEKGNIQLFTQRGEIKSTALINSFISRYNSWFSTNYGSLTEEFLQRPVKVNFLSTDDAQFILFANTIAVHVVTKNNVIYLEAKDTLDTGWRYYEYPSLKPTIYDTMYKYTELYRDIFKVQGVYDTYGIRIKQCYYLTRSGNQLKMPIMNYWYFQSYSTQSWGGINNAFNSSSIGMLEDKDTLAIQQFQVVFK